MMDKNYYIYRHRRLDNNNIFYVGIGTVYEEHKKSATESVYYRRGFQKNRRNNIWNKIVKKTDYITEIILDNISKKDSEELEEFMISIYGRINLGTGSLANLTDGGERNSGSVRTQEYKDKISKSLKGRLSGADNPFYGKNHSEKTKNKMKENHADFSGGKHPRAKKVINIKTGKIYLCAKDVSEELQTNYRSFSAKLAGSKKNNTDFQYYIE